MANTTSTMKNKTEERPGGAPHSGSEPGLMEKGREAASNVAEKVREGTFSTIEKGRDAASNLAEKAREGVSSTAEKANEIASNVGQQAENATSAVACGMHSLAETIREHAPQSGVLRSASTSMADTLESGGRYLREEGLRGIGEDVTNLVRRNPVPALLLGVAFGYLVARATRR